jgi:hypothetical protein
MCERQRPQKPASSCTQPTPASSVPSCAAALVSVLLACATEKPTDGRQQKQRQNAEVVWEITRLGVSERRSIVSGEADTRKAPWATSGSGTGSCFVLMLWGAG